MNEPCTAGEVTITEVPVCLRCEALEELATSAEIVWIEFDLTDCELRKELCER